MMEKPVAVTAPSPTHDTMKSRPLTDVAAISPYRLIEAKVKASELFNPPEPILESAAS